MSIFVTGYSLSWWTFSALGYVYIHLTLERLFSFWRWWFLATVRLRYIVIRNVLKPWVFWLWLEKEISITYYRYSHCLNTVIYIHRYSTAIVMAIDNQKLHAACCMIDAGDTLEGST